MSDSAFWATIASTDTTMLLGLKAAGAARGLIAGKPTISKTAWSDGIARLRRITGVDVLSVDELLPIVRVKPNNAAALRTLRRLPFVAFSEPARSPVAYFDVNDCKAGGTPQGVLVAEPYAGGGADTISQVFDSMFIRNAWKLATGAGVIVGVVGTGMDVTPGSDLHPSRGKAPNIHATVKSQMTPFPNPVSYLTVVEEYVMPVCDHETRLGGLAVGAKNGVGTVGAAYAAGLVSVKQTDDGVLNEDAAKSALAIRYAVERGAKVITLGFGWWFFTANAVSWEIDHHYYNNDVVFVGAAGTCNSGTNCPQIDSPVFPASKGEVLAVTGARHDGSRPYVFNYGSKYEGVVGYSHLASNRMGHPGALDGIAGSSAPTGVVAGIAALIRSRNPSFNRRQVVDRIVRTSGAACGAPAVWRDNMINASAAVGGPCVQRMTGPATVYASGIQSPISFSVLTVKRFADGYAPGGSGSYASQWSPTGSSFPWTPTTGAVREGGMTNGDATISGGTFGWRSQQSYRFLPAHDQQPYVTTISATISDDGLPISEVRSKRVLVCHSPGLCWNTTRGYPGFGVSAFGPSFVNQGGPVTWTASVGEPAGSHSIHWEASFDGYTFSYVGGGSSYTKYVYELEGPYTMWLRAVVNSSSSGVATSPAIPVYVHTSCGGIFIC
jgi:hypothetical protein